MNDSPVGVSLISILPDVGELKLVIERKMPCPACNDSLHVSVDEGAQRQCECVRLRAFWSEFTRNVPPHDRFANLATLQPNDASQLSTTKQQDVIAKLKAAPDKSYAFFGPAGTSKSTYGVALYRWALKANIVKEGGITTPSVWRVSAKSLLDQYVAYASAKEIDGRTASEPTVNRRKIAAGGRAGLRPRLFLEELDKVKYTKFKTDSLFELFDAIYENDGQLVFSTNLTMEGFDKQFDSGVGDALIRRVAEMATVFDFHDGV